MREFIENLDTKKAAHQKGEDDVPPRSCDHKSLNILRLLF